VTREDSIPILFSCFALRQVPGFRNHNEIGAHVMFEANRRIFLQSFAVSAGTLAASQSFAVGSDGRAAGYDVSAASEYLKTIPRKFGDPVIFTA
jgi:hypothetical protein